MRSVHAVCASVCEECVCMYEECAYCVCKCVRSVHAECANVYEECACCVRKCV